LSHSLEDCLLADRRRLLDLDLRLLDKLLGRRLEIDLDLDLDLDRSRLSEREPKSSYARTVVGSYW